MSRNAKQFYQVDNYDSIRKENIENISIFGFKSEIFNPKKFLDFAF